MTTTITCQILYLTDFGKSNAGQVLFVCFVKEIVY